MTDQAVKILLIDDRQEDLLSLEVVLADENYRFFRGNSGRDALRTLLKEEDFAIILIDVQMPLMDGFETASLIRENEKFRNIPIIFLTANNDSPENIFKGYQKGAVDYLIKPVVPAILKAKVSVFVDLYRKNQELIAQRQNLVALNIKNGAYEYVAKSESAFVRIKNIVRNAIEGIKVNRENKLYTRWNMILGVTILVIVLIDVVYYFMNQ